MINSNDLGYKLIANSSFEKSKEIHYSIPYPHKYANMINETGMLSLGMHVFKNTSIIKNTLTGFKFLFTGDSKSKAGKTIHNIELTPLDSKRSYFKVKLQIDKASKQITQAIIFDKNGNRYTYSIKAFAPNVKVAETFFTFDVKKYPGVDYAEIKQDIKDNAEENN